MEHREYQYMLKVAELKNITKAAEALFITQPSLSHFIAKVEENLGAQIFDRGRTPLALTPAGEVYMETARMIMNLNRNMQQTVRDIAENKKGVITLGLSHARASYFLPYVLPEFQRLYSGIEICTLEKNSMQIEEDVVKGNCNLGIIPLPLSHGELHQEVVLREELLLVSGKELPYQTGPAGRKYVELRGWKNQPFVLLRRGHGIRRAINIFAMEQGMEIKNILETTSNETAYRIATTGMACSIVPLTTIELSNYVHKPYIYSLTPEGLFWDIAVVFKDPLLLTRVQQDFIELLKRQFYHA